MNIDDYNSYGPCAQSARYQGSGDSSLHYLCNWNLININLCTSDVDKMVTGFVCSACGETERVQSSSGRRRLDNSSMDGVYELLESILANKVAQKNIQLDFEHLMNQAAYMCKNCYYAYVKHVKSFEVTM